MNLRFHLALVFVVLLPLGCQEGPKVDGVVRSADTESLGYGQESPGNEQSAASKPSLGREAVVPGTVVERSVDDPSQDGWETETVAAAAGGQIKRLLHLLDTEKAEASIKLVAASGASSKSVSANSHKVAFDHNSIVVRRADFSSVTQNDVPVLEGVRALLQGVDSPSEFRSKVKVFRVHVPAGDGEGVRGEVSCSAYVQISGKCSGGRFQVNSTLDCEWQLQESAAPLLNRFVVRDWEQVVAHHDGESMFADCTAAVMQDDEVFREQLLPGIDHWLGTIETRMGIDIGGWQGISIADVNGDGLDDLYCAQPGGLPNRLYVQQADGTCVERSEQAGMDWLDSSHASLFVDLDNDGDQDAVVGLNDGVLVLANDGTGQFTVRAQQILPAALPYSISAADFDSDSDLDIYVCCYNRRSGVNQHLLFARPVPYHDANNGGRNVLLMNEIDKGDSEEWKFRYVTKQLGLDENNRRFSYASAWEDYDNDGDLDLYVANDFGRNNLYQNDTGKFRDVATEAAVEDVAPGMSACWGDYNNDGYVDLYVSNMFSSAGNRIAFQDRFHGTANRETKAEFQRHARGNSLFQNLGDGTFRDVSEDASVTLGRWAWGSRFADLNNDGWQDLIVANGFITQPDTGDL